MLNMSFLALPEHEDDEFACSFHFFKGEEAFVIADGLYDIVATVMLLHSHNLLSFLMCTLLCSV